MAARLEATTSTEATLSADRYVARQPILDAQGRVHGYELLFRDGPQATLAGDEDAASRAILDDAALFGLERYTHGLPGFVHCTPDTLTRQLVQVLPASMTVLVIPAGAGAEPELLKACQELKAAGFRLAVESAGAGAEPQPLAERADYLVVDFSHLSHEARGKLRGELRQFAAAKVATKVATQEDFQQAVTAGFTLFEGDYFCQPVVVKNRKAPANRFFHFELLRHLNRESMDLKTVAELVLRDAALTYRLLRLVNSPICAIPREITSIEMALIIIGEQAFRRMATLAILSELNEGQPQEILKLALVRARFCALTAAMCGQDAGEQYLLGLLSLLPAMLGMPMEALTPSLPLRAPIRDALEGTANPERALLGWIEGHEHGDWAACDALADANSLNVDKLVRTYGEAVDWAKSALHAAT